MNYQQRTLTISFQDCPNLRVVKMTQEIGFVECADDDVIDFDKLPIGKTLFLYQYHSCDMAAKFPVGKSIRGLLTNMLADSMCHSAL